MALGPDANATVPPAYSSTKINRQFVNFMAGMKINPCNSLRQCQIRPSLARTVLNAAFRICGLQPWLRAIRAKFEPIDHTISSLILVPETRGVLQGPCFKGGPITAHLDLPLASARRFLKACISRGIVCVTNHVSSKLIEAMQNVYQSDPLWPLKMVIHDGPVYGSLLSSERPPASGTFTHNAVKVVEALKQINTLGCVPRVSHGDGQLLRSHEFVRQCYHTRISTECFPCKRSSCQVDIVYVLLLWQQLLRVLVAFEAG